MAIIDANRNIENLHLPFAVTPQFARRLGKAAHEGSFADAVVETFKDSGVHFEVEGDTPASEGGLIIASDHARRIEPLLVQAAMSETGRDASNVIAMPTSFSGRLMQDSGDVGSKLVIPVIPTMYSDQYNPTLRENPRDFYRKRRYPHVLNQPKEVLRNINQNALDYAAQELADGQAVTIFPTGGSADLDWQAGLGEIARRVPTERKDKTEVMLFRPDPFSVKRVVGALALREMGIRPRKQTLVLRTANVGTIPDIYDENDTSPFYSRGFTDAVRGAYKRVFK